MKTITSTRLLVAAATAVLGLGAASTASAMDDCTGVDCNPSEDVTSITSLDVDTWWNDPATNQSDVCVNYTGMVETLYAETDLDHDQAVQLIDGWIIDVYNTTFAPDHTAALSWAGREMFLNILHFC